jgi:hypothetical protein
MVADIGVTGGGKSIALLVGICWEMTIPKVYNKGTEGVWKFWRIRSLTYIGLLKIGVKSLLPRNAPSAKSNLGTGNDVSGMGKLASSGWKLVSNPPAYTSWNTSSLEPELCKVSNAKLLKASDWFGDSAFSVSGSELLDSPPVWKDCAGGTHLGFTPPLKLYSTFKDTAGGVWICLTLSFTTPSFDLVGEKRGVSLNRLVRPLLGGTSLP